MEEVTPEQQPSFDIVAKLRDLEDKNRLIRDRTLLLGQTLVEGREESFKEIQELKSVVIKLKDELSRTKEVVQRMSEQITLMARKDELMILERQFDLFRKT